MPMTVKLRTAFKEEMQVAKSLYYQGQYLQSFHHLERAHILGQRHYVPHVINHYWMLKVGWRSRDVREVLGQVLRIIGSAGSLIGLIPIGNTGGANVSAVKPMPIPQDLVPFFDSTGPDTSDVAKHR